MMRSIQEPIRRHLSTSLSSSEQEDFENHKYFEHDRDDHLKYSYLAGAKSFREAFDDYNGGRRAAGLEEAGVHRSM